jgi:hypothetical protein
MDITHHYIFGGVRDKKVYTREIFVFALTKKPTCMIIICYEKFSINKFSHVKGKIEYNVSINNV